MIAIISFVIIFSIIVLSHEFGHFFFARLAGIKVLEMGLGIGPRLFMKVRNGILYTINLLPFGGFIKIAGINPEAETNEDKYRPEESYLSKNPLQKFLTILGGPMFNVVAAFILILLVFLAFGMPMGISNEILQVGKGSEAEMIGLRSGDKVLSINNNKVVDMSEAVNAIHKSAGKKIFLEISRDGQIKSLSAVPRYDKKLKIALIGFSLKPVYKRINPFSAVWEAAKQTVGITILTFYSIFMLISGKFSLADVSGPVGIAQFTGQAAGEGIVALLSFSAFLSINLAVLNLLPIPALDGGRLVFIIIEAIRRKPVDINFENKVHYVGFILLLVLLSVITVNDFIRIFIR